MFSNIDSNYMECIKTRALILLITDIAKPH